MPRNQELYDLILRGRRREVKKLVEDQLAAGADPYDLLYESMIPAMREQGDRFSRGEVFVPEMLIAARAMQAGLDLIEPLLTSEASAKRTRVAIGTVKGDLHDIGKNLVAMMLKGAGYDVVDLGTDCDKEKFAEAATQGAKGIFLSALLTTTMPYMKDVVDHLKDNQGVKVIIGGAPVTQAYAEEIGAHGYGKDASMAVKVFEELTAQAG